jgi:hypothetical protein
MWPDDYIAWALGARPIVVGGIERELYRHLFTNPQWTEAETATLADQATRHAFDMANDHRRYPAYFRTEAEFRVWVYTVALNETLRLLIRHRLGESRFKHLSADQRRMLGLRYLDQLPPGDVAGVLHVSAEEVRQQVNQALDAFFQILGQSDVELGS